MNADSSNEAVESATGVPDALGQTTHVLAVSDKMVLLMWLTFIILAVCLYKLFRMFKKWKKRI